MSIFYLCLKIFFTRIIDVTLGTLRTIMTVKNKVLLASMIGFIEVLIWFLIAKEALEISSNSILIGIFYALGFATGTYIGGLISKKVISGNVQVQVITSNATQEWINKLRHSGFALSIIDINQKEGLPDKYLILLEINNRYFNKLYSLIKEQDKNAFIVVSESVKVINGYFNHK